MYTTIRTLYWSHSSGVTKDNRIWIRACFADEAELVSVFVDSDPDTAKEVSDTLTMLRQFDEVDIGLKIRNGKKGLNVSLVNISPVMNS